jgi:hypothetical protein
MSTIEAQAQATESQDETGQNFLVEGILPRVGLVVVVAKDPYRVAVGQGFGFQLADTAVNRTWGGREIFHRPAVLAVSELATWLGNPPDVGMSVRGVTARSIHDAQAFASFAKTAGVGLIVCDGVAGLRGIGAERAEHELAAHEHAACIVVAQEVAKATPCCVLVATTPGRDADRLSRLAHTVVRVEGAGLEGKITVSRDGEFVAWFGCTFDQSDDSECITLGDVYELPALESAA